MTRTPIRARLVDEDGTTELLRFGAGEAFRLTGINVGDAEPRVVSSPLPGRSGEYDRTALGGAQAVSLELAVVGDAVDPPVTWLRRLRSYCRPAARPYLHVSYDAGVTERRAQVRAEGSPVTFSPHDPTRMQVQWRIPLGVWESTTLQSATLFPVTGTTGGLTFAVAAFPVTFAAGNVTGAALITNAGSETAYGFADLYGFCLNPILKNITTDEQIAFTGLTVNAGDFLRVDMRERVALLSNDAGQSRYSLLDFVTSSWWGLPAGTTSQVAFLPTTPSSTCQAVFYWRDADVL